MRKIVFLLLLVNLGVLTWNLYTRSTTRPVVAAAAPVQPAGDVNQLPLLSELSDDALRPRASQRRADVDSASGEAQGAAAQPTGSASSVATREAQPGPGNESATPPGSSGTEPPANEPLMPVPASTEVAAAAPGTDNGVVGDSVASAATTRNEEPPPRACLTIGPLDADAPIDEISTWLAESGASVDVRTDERREVALFWVYFPPRANRQAALAEVEKLRVEGVTDVIAVPKGDMANAISLGVFSRPESRDRRVREMNERGYQPSVAPRYRVKLATWVDVSTPAGTFDETAFRSLWPTVGVTPKPCERGQIAAASTPSYNAGSSVPRRFHFSGADTAESPGTTNAVR